MILNMYEFQLLKHRSPQIGILDIFNSTYKGYISTVSPTYTDGVYPY